MLNLVDQLEEDIELDIKEHVKDSHYPMPVDFSSCEQS